VWEYVITFDREVALVWSRKVNSASMLFLLNRYIMLVQFAVQLPLSFTISDEVVPPLELASVPAADFPPCTAFSALRAYAMSNRTWPIAVLVFLLSITTACYNITLTTFALNSCTLAHIAQAVLATHLLPPPGTTATRICLIIADALVIGVTWWRTWRFRVSAAQANVRTTFLQLLLRDGS
ncbi:uncharacterized protein TRAVEDRAFT_128901, partial [Trametes versicolor FP-101664 SS1]|uniref:uncharacterized protein n=1 Tax=Trametes versicolor (strain FP-101664) TaxID=717944 RepID=UPI0004621A0B